MTRDEIIVYLDGEILRMTRQELVKQKYNVVKCNTNRYSHDWSEAIEFDEKYIQVIGGKLTIWCTIQNVGRIMNSSIVSFS